MSTVTPEEFLNLEFEGVEAQEPDIPSLTKLLNQLVQESCVDAWQLAKLLVSQNYIGSVLKPALDDVDYDDDEDPEDQPVYSATTIVNLTYRRQEPVVQSIIKFLRKDTHELKAKYAGAELVLNTLTYEDKMSNDACLGWLIKERMINMPWTLLRPSLESLVNDVSTAVNRKMPYSFKYLIYWSKMYKDDDGVLHHIDVEDQWFDENCCVTLTYPLKNADTVMVTNNPSSATATPCRRVYLFQYSKLQSFMEHVKNLASI